MKINELPLTIRLNDISRDAFVTWYHEHKADLEEKLINNGAIKFAGVSIDSLGDFQQIVDSISSRFFNYVDGNSPRLKLSGNVYTSTEYDKRQKITMHNELSYSAKWPNKLFFCCIQPAETGGETLIADSRAILQRMNKSIVSEIEQKGIVYIRNLHGGVGVGPSWQDTFETNDNKVLEDYCKASAIEFEWSENDNLRLKQRSKGIHEHRITREKLWFNQIDQFHPVHLGEDLYAELLTIYSPDEFPMYVTFGDGSLIDESMVKEILSTIEQVTIAPVWNKNELLIIDNELFSHGRNPYTGERKVLVAMSE